MKKYLLIAVSGFTLAGCGERSGGDWSSDCMTYHSVTGRELSECKAKVEAQRKLEIEPGVNIDPGNMSREGFGETGKSMRGAELNPENK